MVVVVSMHVQLCTDESGTYFRSKCYEIITLPTWISCHVCTSSVDCCQDFVSVKDFEMIVSTTNNKTSHAPSGRVSVVVCASVFIQQLW